MGGYHQLPVTPYQPQQENVLDQYARIQQLKGMQGQQQLQQQALQTGQLENQQRQLDLQSQQAMMKAYTEADGDLNKALPLAAKYGAKPADLMNLRMTGIKQQQANIELLNAKGARALQEADMMQGAYDTVAKSPVEQKPAVYQQQLQGLSGAGVDVSQMPQQYPGDQEFQAIGLGLKGHKQQLDDLAKQTDIKKTIADTAEKTANAEFYQKFGVPKGTSDSTQFMANYLASNNLPNTPENRMKAQKEYIKETKVDPGIARLQVLGQFGMEVADPNNPGQTMIVPRAQANGYAGKASASVTVPRKEAEYMTSGAGGKQLTAFNTAIVHLNTLDRLAGDLNNTDLRIANRAKQAWAEQTGNPAPANFEAAKNAMSGEVAAALKASGATDQEISHVGSTFDRAQSPAQLKGAINTYRELLTGKANQLKNQYQQGMQGKPNFGEQNNSGGDFFSQFGGTKR